MHLSVDRNPRLLKLNCFKKKLSFCRDPMTNQHNRTNKTRQLISRVPFEMRSCSRQHCVDRKISRRVKNFLTKSKLRTHFQSPSHTRTSVGNDSRSPTLNKSSKRNFHISTKFFASSLISRLSEKTESLLFQVLNKTVYLKATKIDPNLKADSAQVK